MVFTRIFLCNRSFHAKLLRKCVLWSRVPWFIGMSGGTTCASHRLSFYSSPLPGVSVEMMRTPTYNVRIPRKRTLTRIRTPVLRASGIIPDVVIRRFRHQDATSTAHEDAMQTRSVLRCGLIHARVRQIGTPMERPGAPHAMPAACWWISAYLLRSRVEVRCRLRRSTTGHQMQGNR